MELMENRHHETRPIVETVMLNSVRLWQVITAGIIQYNISSAGWGNVSYRYILTISAFSQYLSLTVSNYAVYAE
jgi:hypothetical protein